MPRPFRRDPEGDEPERSFWYDTVPKWGPTVGVAVIAATIVATFVVVCVIGFGWVVPVLNNGYLVTNKATGALDYVVSLADAPYSEMSRNVLNVRAERPADSFRQTVQMIPGLVNHADTILQKIDVDFVVGGKFASVFARAFVESGIEAMLGAAGTPLPGTEPELPPPPAEPAPPADPVVGIPPLR